MVESGHRRWFQFRLRTLLIVILVLSLPLSWLAVKMNAAWRRKEAVDAIRRAGGMVLYGPGAKAIPEGMREFFGDDLFLDVVQVFLAACRFGDEEAIYLERLGHLEAISLSTETTDAGLEHIKGLTHLDQLLLNDTKITDAGLEHLKGLTALRLLSLQYTHITDDGLEHLKGLTNLEWLCLEDTEVTREGVERLQVALPNCKIEY